MCVKRLCADHQSPLLGLLLLVIRLPLQRAAGFLHEDLMTERSKAVEIASSLPSRP